MLVLFCLVLMSYIAGTTYNRGMEKEKTEDMTFEYFECIICKKRAKLSTSKVLKVTKHK